MKRILIIFICGFNIPRSKAFNDAVHDVFIFNKKWFCLDYIMIVVARRSVNLSLNLAKVVSTSLK